MTYSSFILRYIADKIFVGLCEEGLKWGWSLFAFSTPIDYLVNHIEICQLLIIIHIYIYNRCVFKGGKHHSWLHHYVIVLSQLKILYFPSVLDLTRWSEPCSPYQFWSIGPKSPITLIHFETSIFINHIINIW